MRFKDWKPMIGGKSQFIVFGAFVVLGIMSLLDEVLDLPNIIFGAPPTPLNWAEIAIEVVILLLVCLISIYILSLVESKRKQAEEALQESEQNFRALAENASDGVLIATEKGAHVYANKAAAEITGYDVAELLGINMKDLAHPDEFKKLAERLQKRLAGKNVPRHYETAIIRKDGEKVPIEISSAQTVWRGQPAVIIILHDITVRKQAEEEKKRLKSQIFQAQKMEAVGTLAGGIAHDFNNMLTAVLGNISLAQMEIKPGSKVFELITGAEEAAMRAKDLTARLITFSKGGEPVKKEVSIGKFVKDYVSSVLSGSNIHSEFSIPDDLWSVNIDERQMKQVVHNIVTNAIEAMAGQGRLKVYCENADIGEKDGLMLKDGKYVKISIKDHGIGIPEENFSKIFDPYFSTKEMGIDKGMGLGLATSHSIVKKHYGLITVESELGASTTVYIYIPKVIEKIPEKEVKQSPIINRKSQIQRILVMDDEETVRDVSAKILDKLGYEVELAVDGVEAIELYKKSEESGRPFDGVILDLTNKFGMGGVEAIKRLLEIDSGIKAIVATGYSNDPIMSNFGAYGFKRCSCQAIYHG